MNDLERYVEGLFAGHRETRETGELKAEILGNLEARLADYIEEGLSHEQALARTKQSLDNVDDLLPRARAVYINRFRIELLQAALLYTVIAWVLTMPLRLIPSGIIANTILLLLVLGLGLSYLSLSFRKERACPGAVAPLDQERSGRQSRTAWLLWALLISLTAVLTTLKHFGSAIWFGRPLHLDGPHQFALVAVAYLLPLVTVIVPLLFTKARYLAKKYEVEP
jgi:hypothetical protein